MQALVIVIFIQQLEWNRHRGYMLKM